ncbi:ASKHA domain-containing protein [Desulfuromonas carbonis]|uniref:ASKHA domain-containing protein n=1 Tax=Desulfuromonas sp. DDH964 TaxID=1823759 RepID=UPI00078D9E24|nr:ASKHA domain-containing protein [Desulfuromonas sp. DDH964]AMV73167.1 hypothetical protein DBW_2857 [Desulfuromonas sp. DDH964]
MNISDLRIAFDLGTTTLGARLLDGAGRICAETRAPNPQVAQGRDVIRRLAAARGGAALPLQQTLVAAINGLTTLLCRQAGCSPGAIAAAAAAANPAVSLLLQRLPVDAVLFPPYRPPQRSGVQLDAAALGLALPVPLYLFPLVSGYVGGDLVAFLYGQDAAPGRLLLDIGTNGEIAWFDGNNCWVTSVAAGPAFEGGEISCGIDYGPGAVTAVRVQGERLELTVAGGAPPRGLCGSGLVSAIAAARGAGLIDQAGTLVDPLTVGSNLARYLVEGPEGRRLHLYRDARCELFLTQQDIRSFQLAKGALHAGVAALLQRAGAAGDQVREVVVTGAFGLSLAPEDLKKVALLPPDVVDKVRFVPAGALAGVGRMLLATDGVDRVEALAANLTPNPLSGTPAFQQGFLKALDF